MMRRSLAVAVVGVGLLTSSGTQRPASAIICANCAQEITQQLNWGQNWVEMGKQLEQARSIYTEVQGTYTQARTVWSAATRITDLGSAVGALGTIGIQNPLPVNPYSMQALLNGTGGIEGSLASLNGLLTSTQTTNQVYRVQGGNFAQDEMIRRASALSGSQSVSLQLHQSAAERSPLLAQLQARLATARDPTEREALMVRLQAETAQIQNQQVQAQAAASYQAAQAQVDQLRQEERLQKSIDEALTVLDGRTGAPASAPATASVGS
ncbi:hypothetical protein D9599_19340 [Roseomonas sp. KE2513]|nr:hypothetical protein [Roseomonas sp. KE2513]